MRKRTILPVPSRSRLVQAGAFALLVAAAACGGSTPASPAAPSPAGTSGAGATSAVIAGTVTGSQAGPSLAGLTAQVMGTNLSSAVSEAGAFEIAGVPTGTVRLQFRNSAVNATANVSDVKADQIVQLRVQVTGTTAVIVEDSREGKVSLCHAEDNGSYHLIDVSVSAEPAHRAHGDGKIGDPVPGRPNRIFDADCRPVGPEIRIEKFTNGDDAESAPGPSILVGSAVTWRYVVTNTGTVGLTNVAVVDDKGVTLTCVSQPILAPGAIMTCTGTGVAALGQYRNLGTVTANWTMGSTSGTVTDSDPSHYLGVAVIADIAIEKFTNGEDADSAPGPSILVGSAVTWRYVVTNTGAVGLTNVAVVDDKGVTVTCVSQPILAPGATMTCTGTGVATLGQYRNLGTVTANWTMGSMSGTVTDSDPSHYLGVAATADIAIKKFTNGEDADSAPGPSILVGSAVTWRYVVTNTGAVGLTNVAVVDDKGVTVTCVSQPILAPGATMTCTGTGVATLGQYRNLGTVTANWTMGSMSGMVTDSDPSHYLGVIDDDNDRKVSLCHKTGNGSFHLIEVSVSAEPAHIAHGDGKPLGPVPGQPGKVFTASCGVQ